MTLEKLKQQTEEFLSAKNVGINISLPLIEDLSEVTPQDAKTIAKRLCSLTYVIGMGYGAEQTKLIDYLTKYNLLDAVSDYERKLLFSEVLSEQGKIDCTWLTEASQVLAWSLKLVELDNFVHCDDDLIEKIPLQEDPSEFINSSELRPIIEIQAMVDQLYRLHWFAINCKTTSKDCFYSESIIRERRRAIDWIYGIEPNWDEVPSDT
jgi:uncharacterized protein DUF4272